MALGRGANVGSVFIDVNANAENFHAGMQRAKIEAQRSGAAMSSALDNMSDFEPHFRYEACRRVE